MMDELVSGPVVAQLNADRSFRLEPKEPATAFLYRALTRETGTVAGLKNNAPAGSVMKSQFAAATTREVAQLVRGIQAVIDSSPAGLSPDELLPRILVRAVEFLGAEGAVIWCAEEDRRGLSVRAVVGFEDDIARELSSPKGRGLALRIWATHSPICVNDLSRIRIVGTSLYERLRSLIGAPLMIDGEVVGIIYVATTEREHFEASDLEALRLVADYVGPVVGRMVKERRVRYDRDRNRHFGAMALTGLRVLVVDDDADARELMTLILSRCQAEVKAVASADEAMKILVEREEWLPDALVSDIEMPGKSGYAFMRQVRAMERECSQIPAVAVTAQRCTEDQARALAAGFQLQIAKPLEPDELVTVVAGLTGRLL